LPEGWAEATFEEIVVHKLGGEWGADPEAAEGDPDLVRVRVIRGTDFREWERDKGATAQPRAVKRASLEKRQLRAGDLVIEISGGGVSQPVGRAVLIDEETLRRADAPLICSNFCRQVRIHREIDPAFVHLALTSLYLGGGLNEYQTQTTNLRNLRFRDFLSGVVLPIPPRAEQERIVERVGELRAAERRSIEGIARVPAILRRFRQSVLSAAYSGRLTEDWREARQDISGRGEPFACRLERAFEARRQAYREACLEAEAFERRAPRRPKNLSSSPWEVPEPLEEPEVPEGWSLVALHDVIRRAQYGLSVKADAKPREGVPMLRMVNIRDGRMDASDLKHVARDKAELPVYRVRRGDILFNRTNSAELVGKAAVFDLDLEAVFASYLVRIECDEELVSSRYLCAWMSSPWGRRWARTVRTDCSNQSNINVSRLQTMPVPVPPLAEQHEIVRRIEASFAFVGAVEEHVATAAERAEKLRRTVLTRALRGELVPTEAELARQDGSGGSGYEPVADLLERIGAERSGIDAVAGPAEAISERILTTVRQSCWGSGEMTREELVRKVAARLGCPKFGRNVRARLEAHVEAALARRILARKGDLLIGATPTFGRYDFVFLMRTVLALAEKGVEHEKDEVIDAVATYLGYGQVTVAIRERMERVLDWAAGNGEVEIRGGRLVIL
jgi:type I restriction enzyme S subunit